MMNSKPITSRSKSTPLHVEEELLGKKKVVDASGNVLNADDKGQATAGTPAVPEKRRTKLYSDLPESDREAARQYNQEEYGTLNPTAEGKADNTLVTQKGQEGTEGGFDRETEYSPELTQEAAADKVDTFYPWEARFAQRTQRGAVRDEKRRGRKGVRQLNRALRNGVIDQAEYDTEFAQANKMKYGQGNIAQAQIGIDGGIKNTEQFDAITSQGMQANRKNSLTTDMNRRPKGEVEGGQSVRADGTEDMTKDQYEAGNVKPNTSTEVQQASAASSNGTTATAASSDGATASAEESTATNKKASSSSLPGEKFEPMPMGAAYTIDENQVAQDDKNEVENSANEEVPNYEGVQKQGKISQLPSKEAKMDSVSGAGEFDLRDVGTPAKPRSSSKDMFGGMSQSELSDIDEALTDRKNANINGANAFTGDAIQANVGTGTYSDTKGETPEKTKQVDGTPLAPALGGSVVEVKNDVDGTPVLDDLNKSLVSSPANYRLKRDHNSRMMYGNSPNKMWGPSKKANAGESTGAKNVDESTLGRPVTQNITRSAKGIVTGKLNQSSAFKMKGYGKK
mgnify:FL=1